MCLRTCLQLLANATTAAEEARQSCWSALFPDTLVALLGRESDQTFSLASAVVYNCVRASEERCKALAGTDGGLLMGEMVSRLCAAQTQGETEGEGEGHREGYEWAVLVTEALVSHGHASDVYSTLSGLPQHASQLSAAWLWLLPDHTHHLQENDVRCLAGLYATTAKAARDADGFWDGSDEDTRRVIAAWLQLWCALSSDQSLCISRAVADSGLVEHTVGLLRDAGVRWPMTKPRHGVQHTSATEYEAHTRADVVRLLGNLAFHCPPLQDEIRNSGGMPAILNCCQMDERNPVVKEWYAAIAF